MDAILRWPPPMHCPRCKKKDDMFATREGWLCWGCVSEEDKAGEDKPKITHQDRYSVAEVRKLLAKKKKGQFSCLDASQGCPTNDDLATQTPAGAQAVKRVYSRWIGSGKKKRKSPPAKVKRVILERQRNKCLYCSVLFGGDMEWRRGLPIIAKVCWDHKLPYS